MSASNEKYDSFSPIDVKLKTLQAHKIAIVTEPSELTLLTQLESVLHTIAFTTFIDIDKIGDINFKSNNIDLMVIYSKNLHHTVHCTKTIREKCSEYDLAIIVITSDDDPKVQLELLDAGVDDFVSQPFDNRLLKAKVRNKIEHIDLFRHLKCEQERVIELERFGSIYSRIQTFTRSVSKYLRNVEMHQTRLASSLVSKQHHSVAEEICKKAISDCEKIKLLVEAMRLLSEDRFLGPPKILYKDLPEVLLSFGLTKPNQKAITIKLNIDGDIQLHRQAPESFIRTSLKMLELANAFQEKIPHPINLIISIEPEKNTVILECQSLQTGLSDAVRQQILAKFADISSNLTASPLSFDIQFKDAYWSSMFTHRSAS